MRPIWMAAGLLIASARAMGATTIECPPVLKVTSSVEAPAGWEVMPPKYQALLDNITVYAGHPSQMASLVPDDLPVKRGMDVGRWSVDDDTWLECSYIGTNATIAKQLPKGFKTCTAYYEHRKYGVGPFKKMVCE